ncbi:MarR family transcriptional regulator [Lujinxingia litoralis]|uniref:MarR family transcriptional regulator n=1 Tax=Lujinxingia litoralis TaxID=2211119 RepID=A0A328C2F8_9DELT|nr:MarR family winged helix-turn-helix transcriptional regulator [Lujinxingia litoralis]RAL20105.1 MarR family transcriptional regulator [Lujinxingia litoralis]
MSNKKNLPHATTLHVRDHCLCLAAQRANRALARRFDEALRPVGLTSGQFSLLMSLNRPAPPSMGAVASLLAMARTTLTANLKPLQRQGLVVVRVDPDDHRGRLLELTPAGHEALLAAMPIWERTHAEIDALVGEEAAEPLRQALAILAEL